MPVRLPLPCTSHLQTQVIALMQRDHNVEPGFTLLVWQKLKEQNPDFFKV